MFFNVTVDLVLLTFLVSLIMIGLGLVCFWASQEKFSWTGLLLGTIGSITLGFALAAFEETTKIKVGGLFSPLNLVGVYWMLVGLLLPNVPSRMRIALVLFGFLLIAGSNGWLEAIYQWLGET